MNKTTKVAAISALMAVMIAGFSGSSAHASVSNTQFEFVPWVSGELIKRTTVTGTCGEGIENKLQMTYFDDYVHVLYIDQGKYDIQRYFDYSVFDEIVQEIIQDDLVYC